MKFTKEQNDAIDRMAPLVCVAAGAGSGKTSILVERIMRILESPTYWDGQQPELDKIVAITFTEKAAAEMKARLRKRFRAAASVEDPKQMQFWRNAERQLDNTRICTIHSFCAGILRQSALQIGMDPDWMVLEESEAEQLIERTVTDTLHQLLLKKDETVVRLAIALSRHELIDTIVQLIKKRWKLDIHETYKPYQSSHQLVQFWQNILPQLQQDLPRLPGYRQKAADLLRSLQELSLGGIEQSEKRELQRIACMELLKSISSGKKDIVNLIREYLDTYSRVARAPKNQSAEQAEAFKELLNKIKNFLKNECLLPEWKDTVDERAAQLTCDFFYVGTCAIEMYKRIRREKCSLDYDDMITDTLALLRSNAVVRNRVAESIKFLLIDEFQDTDERQYAIAELLAATPAKPQLFIVGDVKQSIYYFRGAEVELFKSIMKENSKHVLPLRSNFRTIPDILSFINDFFGRSQLLGAVEEYKPMTSSRPLQGRPTVEIYVPFPEETKIPLQKQVETDAQFVAKRILELCDPITPFYIPEGPNNTLRPVIFDDIVLLFRRGTNMEVYESALREAEIPYNRVAGTGFFQRREILDLIAFLKLILDPWDEEALVGFLRSPLAGLSDECLMRLALMPGGLAAAFHSNELPEKTDEQEALMCARETFKKFFAIRHESPANVLRLLLEHTKIEAVLLGMHLGLQRAANVRKVVQLADNFCKSQPATLFEFVQYLADATFRELQEGESTLQAKGAGAVTLMTIHKVKGLEFPIVFIPEMFVSNIKRSRERIFYHSTFGIAAKPINEEEEKHPGVICEAFKRMHYHNELMESARILYVAMTRAKDYLILCSRPDAHPSSWASQINQCYVPKEANDGTIVSGKDWAVQIRRTIGTVAYTKRTKRMAEVPEHEYICRAIYPIDTSLPQSSVISVSELLSRMVKTEDEIEDDVLKVQEERLLSPDSVYHFPKRQYAVERGILLHRFFELWDFMDDHLPNVHAIVRELQWEWSPIEGVKNDLDQTIQKFKNSSLWPLCTSAHEIMREVPFILKLDQFLIYGVIDALLDNRIIVDYKTGSRNDSRELRYTWQLLIYAAALKSITGQCPQQGILCYLDSGEIDTLLIDSVAIKNTITKISEFLKTPTTNFRVTLEA